MAQTLYTVKDLAAMTAISKDADNVRRVMRQIRHWTNNEVLRPFGPKSTGTGVSRVYDEHGARKAAILVELSRYGITVDMLEGFDAWCDSATTTEEWQFAVRGENGGFYLAVTWDPEEAQPGKWRVMTWRELSVMDIGYDDEILPDDPDFLDFSSLIIINLTDVFQRLERA